MPVLAVSVAVAALSQAVEGLPDSSFCSVGRFDSLNILSNSAKDFKRSALFFVNSSSRCFCLAVRSVLSFIKSFKNGEVLCWL